MFDKILIANRGEIAVRIIRTCKRMNIRTVAVYSEIDSRSVHVREADEAFLLGPAPSKDSYLKMKAIIKLALKEKCQAIHPGYGFLSENTQFARKVSDAGLVFIGPPAEAMALMSDKIASKKLALKAGVPVVPGPARALSDPGEIADLAGEIGFPVLLKPAAGGGGKGMRIVNHKEELKSALEMCQQETRKAFGDERIFLERYISHPRHIEVQILADRSGRVIHLGERECSIQRRYQKMIEETPSPALTEDQRLKIGAMACTLAQEAGYVNAGTVEFVLDQESNFYFLEMNTRLQVEHPVTEMVTGLDLVELQLRIADGQPLPIEQKEVRFKGWAIEARICAEDPQRGFLPDTGMVTRYAVPRGKNVRVDSGVEAGSLVSIFYDSLLAKAVAWGENRETARETLVQALNGYHLEGVITNLDFVNAVLTHPAFIHGELSTDFIAEHFEEGRRKIPPTLEVLHHMVIAVTLIYHNRIRLVRESLKPMATNVGLAPQPQEWVEYSVKAGDDRFEIHLFKKDVPREWVVVVDDITYKINTPEFEFFRRRLRLIIDDKSPMFRLQYQGNFIVAAHCGVIRTFEIYTPREWELSQYMPKAKEAVALNVLTCPMPGLVVTILAKAGDRVFKGQDLVSIESMKMESFVASPCDGIVDQVSVRPGQAVETGEVLLTFKKELVPAGT
ncbi:MAG: acetyl/propionyl-CoA carboxylase subunit alpha [Desulfobacca sp.]|nr:acetyl/propionyl-CoA carboxylase subunit alpha [Desulfobacca sp.]